jgi:hypothetical protein
MIDAARELIGKEAVLGIGLYLAGAWLAAGPIAERVAVRDYLPLCIVGLSEGSNDSASSSLDPQQELALGLTQELLGKLPGEVGDLGRSIIDGAKRRAEEQRRKAGEAVARMAPDRCQCRMRLALEMTRMDFALWVGTLKLHQPASVRDFGSVMATVDRNNVCGGK